MTTHCNRKLYKWNFMSLSHKQELNQPMDILGRVSSVTIQPVAYCIYSVSVSLKIVFNKTIVGVLVFGFQGLISQVHFSERAF